MMKATILSFLGFFVLQSQSFAPSSQHGRVTVPKTTTALNLNIPRLPLPDAIGDALEGIDLQNPNDMTTEEYNAYSGAAIGGTLIFFLLPGANVAGVPDIIAQVLAVVVKDFLFSAIVGGGIAIYLSLRKDDVGATVRGYGTQLLDKVDDVLGISDPQIEAADEEEDEK